MAQFAQHDLDNLKKLKQAEIIAMTDSFKSMAACLKFVSSLFQDDEEQIENIEYQIATFESCIAILEGTRQTLMTDSKLKSVKDIFFGDTETIEELIADPSEKELT